MVAAVLKLDGRAFGLFHVEQTDGERWFYRWRIRQGAPAPYLAWRSGSTEKPFLLLHSELGGALLEVEWRPDETGGWRQAALHRIAAGSARFRLSALGAVSMRERFLVLAPVNGGVAAWWFEPVTLAAGESVEVTALADAPVVANVLLAEGVLKVEAAGLRVENVSPSEGALVPDEGFWVLAHERVVRPNYFTYQPVTPS